MNQPKIFYSWQSDLANSTNRGFIEKALRNAAKMIKSDETIEVEPVIDRDTVGVPGSPDIANTIFSKIEEAKIFVCDVSIINGADIKLIEDLKADGKLELSFATPRPVPNPNVLIELGYAIKKLTWERVIMVMNTAYGEPRLLPFDLGLKRATTYCMPIEQANRATARKELEKTLIDALKTIFFSLDDIDESDSSNVDEVINAFEDHRPNRLLLLRRFLERITKDLTALIPDFSTEEEPDELLARSIDNSLRLVVEFVRVVEVIVIMADAEALSAIYNGFAALLERYNFPRGTGGVSNSKDFDFQKFVGHELFVSFFAVLIRERRWNLIADLLDENIYIDNIDGTQHGPVSFDYVSEYVQLLDDRNKRLNLSRVSVHADLLNQRHTEGDLAKILPMKEFMEADYFLFIRGELDTKGADSWMKWRPWSTLYMRNQVPKFLEEAKREKYAKQLILALNVGTIDAFKKRLVEIAPTLDRLFKARTFFVNPLEHFDIDGIGLG